MSMLFSRFMLRAGLLALALAGASGAAQAQDGIVLRDIFGKLGIFPEEKEPIEYRERAPLVVPKETGKLRAPEETPAQARNSQWPVDPDAEARKREAARRNEPSRLLMSGRDAGEGGRLSTGELARGRSQRGAAIGESTMQNDRAGVRLNPDEWAAQGKQASAPSYPPGTEPPRKYLTDPPVGLRRPSAAAPMARTSDDPVVVEGHRPSDTWKRLD